MRWRAARAGERRLADLAAAAAVAGVLTAPLWLALGRLLPRCALRAWTGIPCPTCGSTRAAAAAVAGRPLDAVAANPLAAVVGLTALAAALTAPIWVRVAGVPERIVSLPRSWRIAAVLLVLANWAYLVAVGR